MLDVIANLSDYEIAHKVVYYDEFRTSILVFGHNEETRIYELYFARSNEELFYHTVRSVSHEVNLVPRVPDEKRCSLCNYGHCISYTTQMNKPMRLCFDCTHLFDNGQSKIVDRLPPILAELGEMEYNISIMMSHGTIYAAKFNEKILSIVSSTSAISDFGTYIRYNRVYLIKPADKLQVYGDSYKLVKIAANYASRRITQRVLIFGARFLAELGITDVVCEVAAKLGSIIVRELYGD